MDKVYCSECEHYRAPKQVTDDKGNQFGWTQHYCNSPDGNWFSREENHADPKVKNANNDCPDFQEKDNE